MNDNEKAIEILENIDIEANNGYSKEDVEHTYLMAILALKQQLNNGWIPVSERLPEEYGKYLATVKHLDGDCEVWEATYFKEEWAEMSNHPSWKVIAWRPLPEPWEGEEE